MTRSLNTAGTGMVAQQFNLDTIANNLANVNTTSFKQQRAEFSDLFYQTFKASGANSGGTARQPITLQIGLGSKYTASSTNFASGPLQATGNPLDIAINGDGFFQIEMPNGRFGYTRDGSLKRDVNGLVVTSDGYALQPAITIPAGSTAISISEAGVVSAILPGQSEPQEIGTITLAMFANPSGLTRIGQNLYEAGGASGEAQIVNANEEGAGKLQSGFLEGSNVQVVEEMVKMIMAQRAYEINSKAIMTADEMLSILNQLKR
jgi:flagellar basal-body rod protein FlgG